MVPLAFSKRRAWDFAIMCVFMPFGVILVSLLVVPIMMTWACMKRLALESGIVDISDVYIWGGAVVFRSKVTGHRFSN